MLLYKYNYGCLFIFNKQKAVDLLISINLDSLLYYQNRSLVNITKSILQISVVDRF